MSVWCVMSVPAVYLFNGVEWKHLVKECNPLIAHLKNHPTSGMVEQFPASFFNGWNQSLEIDTGIKTFNTLVLISRLESRLLKLESWYQDLNQDSQILSLDIKTGIETFRITVPHSPKAGSKERKILLASFKKIFSGRKKYFFKSGKNITKQKCCKTNSA